MLETLELSDPKGRPVDFTDPYLGVVSSVFGGRASLPRISSVVLYAAPITWEAHPFRNLLHLELSHFTKGKETRVERIACRN